MTKVPSESQRATQGGPGGFLGGGAATAGSLAPPGLLLRTPARQERARKEWGRRGRRSPISLMRAPVPHHRRCVPARPAGVAGQRQRREGPRGPGGGGGGSPCPPLPLRRALLRFRRPRLLFPLRLLWCLRLLFPGLLPGGLRTVRLGLLPLGPCHCVASLGGGDCLCLPPGKQSQPRPFL